MFNKLIQKTFKIMKHAYNGTLIDAINYKIKARHQHRREKEWEILKVQGKIVQDRLFDKIRINLYPDDKLSGLIFAGNFERVEQEFVRNYLRRGDVFIDIGANIGLFTLIAAKIVRPNGQIFAFEPTQITYQRLLQNIELNHFNNVQCIQMALSDKVESRILFTSIDGYGAWNSLANPAAGEQRDREIVQCITWDKFSSDNHLTGKTTLMKIDIEGWELYALNGSEKTLTRNDAPDLLVEFTEINAQNAGTSCAALYNRLVEFGYKIYYIDISNRVLTYDPLRESYPYINLLATKRIDFVCGRLGFRIA